MNENPICREQCDEKRKFEVCNEVTGAGKGRTGLNLRSKTALLVMRPITRPRRHFQDFGTKKGKS